VDRTQKKELIAELHRVFEETSIVIVAHNNGLTVAQMTDLRRKMRQAGASFKVTKNRLTRLALDGTAYATLSGLFTGPTAIATAKDPVAAAKVAVEFAKGNDKLVILGGAFGDKQLDIGSIKTLAELPSLDALRAKIVGMVQTPATRIAGVLQAPAGQIARVLSAHAEKAQAA
jgi:large subunit ribosomal protein L10